MGDSAVVYRQKLESGIAEAEKHLFRLETAFSALSARYSFPITIEQFHSILVSDIELAFADQIIYRFSKVQDCMGAKLFKSFLLYQGESVDRPFLDILNELEKIDVVKVDSWFELREIRNEISHEYEDNDAAGMEIINDIYRHRVELQGIVKKIKRMFE